MSRMPYEEFLKVQEELEDYEDLRSLREARESEADAPTIGIDELKKRLRKSKTPTPFETAE